ncbi:MAG: zinc metalloprotease HtpX [Blastocatellia bacterium]
MKGWNQMKTMMLLAALTALVMFMGRAIGGQSGMIIALGIAAIGNVVSWWMSDKIVLRMYRATPVTEHDAPELYGMVRELTQRGQMPMPKVYVIPESTPNAFATGRNPNHAAVAVTEGIMRMLSPDELRGVLAHELAHIKNRDTLVMTVAATIAGALSHLATMAMFMGGMGGRHADDDEDGGGSPLGGLLGIIIAPFAASLIQMAISRSREYMADAEGARISGNPMGLANALRKIESYSQQIPMRAGDPATAHLFIINPFTAGGLSKLFSTHPATQERIARLEAMARGGA